MAPSSDDDMSAGQSASALGPNPYEAFTDIPDRCSDDISLSYSRADKIRASPRAPSSGAQRRRSNKRAAVRAGQQRAITLPSSSHGLAGAADSILVVPT